MTPYRVAPPAETPVTLAEIKAHLHVMHDAHNDQLTAYIAAAAEHLDGYRGVLRRCVISQQWAVGLPCWPVSRSIRLPFPDATAVAISYFDADGAAQAIDTAAAGKIVHDAAGSAFVFRRSFALPGVDTDLPEPITVTETCGLAANAAAAPEPVKLAIKQLVNHWYDNRAAVSEIRLTETPLGVADLLAPLRAVRV